MGAASYTQEFRDRIKYHMARGDYASNDSALDRVGFRYSSFVGELVRKEFLARKLVMSIFAPVVFLLSASTSSGSDDFEDVQCPAQFHQPPIIARGLYVDRMVEDDFIQKISAHAHYWIHSYISDFAIYGRRAFNGASFKMMISDASPLSKEYDIRSNPPASYEYFDILVRTTNEIPIWSLLDGGKTGRDNPQLITLENGIVVQGPGDMEYTDEFLYEFERVTWASGKIYPYNKWEKYVLRDDFGEITEILSCKLDDSMLVPDCRIDFKIQPLWVSLEFDESFLDELPKIRQHGHQFVRCLLQ